jgi:hypothetical protein
VVTTSPESRQIKTGKRNKADDGTSSETSTSMTGDDKDNDRDKDNDSDEDEDDRDDSEPKDHRELSGNSAGIAKGGGGGTYSNAATPIAPAANEGDSAGITKGGGGGTHGNAATPIAPATNEGNSASGINNNDRPWGGTVMMGRGGRLWGGHFAKGGSGGTAKPPPQSHPPLTRPTAPAA